MAAITHVNLDDFTATRHAGDRFRQRVAESLSATASVEQDLVNGVIRRNPPLWLVTDEAAEAYVVVPEDHQGPERCYILRDGAVITVVNRPDEKTANQRHRQRRSSRSRHRDRRHR